MANSAVVGILRALLTLDTAEFDAAAKRVSNWSKDATKDFKAIGQQATQLGTALTKTVTLPLLGLGAGAVKVAMDFESSFANVRKTVDASEEDLSALAQTFRDMAKEIPATTDELNAIAALGGQMGVPIQQLEKFTMNVAALGVAVDGISTEEAAAGLAQIGNVVGTGAQDVDKMASALVHLGNKSSATEADILEFTKRLIGAGNAVGMTVPEVMALGTAMANVGINAEAGGTAMSTVIGKMSMAVSEGGDKLKDFAKVAGTSAKEFATLFKAEPIEAVNAFIKGLGTLQDRGVDLNLTMADMGFKNVRVADTLKRLAGAGDGVATSLQIANEGFDSANKHLEEAEKKYATTANQAKLLWNQIKDVGITIGNALLPMLQGAITLVNSLLPAVEFLGDAFAAMPTGIQAGIVAFGLLLASAGPLLFVFGQLALAASALTGAFAANGIATRTLAAAQATLAGTSGTLGASWLLAAGKLGLYSAALLGGAAIAVSHEKALKDLEAAAEDLATADMKVLAAEIDLQRAIDNGNDLLAAKLRAELNAVMAGRDRAKSANEQAASEARVARALKESEEAQKGNAAATVTSADATDRYTKEVKDLAATLSGSKLQDDVKELAEAVALVGLDNVSEAQWRKLHTQITKMVEEGAKLPPVLRSIITPTQTLSAAFPPVAANMEAITAGLQKMTLVSHLSATAADDLYESMGRAMEATGKTALATIEFAGAAVSDTAGEKWDGLTDAANDSAEAWNLAGNTITRVFAGIASSSTGATRVVADAVSQVSQIISQAFGPNGFSGGDLGAAMATYGASVVIENIAMGMAARERTKELERLIEEMGAEPERRTGSKSKLQEYERQYEALVTAAKKAEQAARDHEQALEDESDAVDRVRKLTEQYGISFDGLGQKVTEADLAQKANELAEAWDFLVNKRFADSQTVLEGMTDEAQEFIDRALSLGIRLPASMEPMLQKMIEMGLLVDANGEKLESLEGIEFAKTIEEGIGDVANALLGLPDKMVEAFEKAFGGIGAQATNLADDLHKKLGNVKIKAGLELSSGGWFPNIGALTESVPSFENRPLEKVTREGLAMVHPGDVIGVPGAGSSAILEAIREDLQRLPGEITRGWRAAMQLM